MHVIYKEYIYIYILYFIVNLVIFYLSETNCCIAVSSPFPVHSMILFKLAKSFENNEENGTTKHNETNESTEPKPML